MKFTKKPVGKQVKNSETVDWRLIQSGNTRVSVMWESLNIFDLKVGKSHFLRIPVSLTTRISAILDLLPLNNYEILHLDGWPTRSFAQVVPEMYPCSSSPHTLHRGRNLVCISQSKA